MKKHVFFIILFLGSFVTYSQVGIGTPMPNSSSQLEIVASNRGVLIPRLNLVNSTDASTITSGNVNSLLVFNTAAVADIKPGYYYWYNNKWNRIVIDSETSTAPGTVIYNSTTKEFSYVDPSGNLQPIDFSVIVKANETITTQTQDLGTGTITYTNEAGATSTSQVVSKNTNNLLVVGTDGGAMLLPSAITKTITVSNASSGNTSTITVDGITSSGAPIINTNETSLSGTSLTTTVNGVASTALDLTPAITAGTTNALSLSGNTLTSNVNGITSSSDAVSGVSNVSSVNTSTVTVNGITSSGAPIINANETSLSGASLTTTVNGVASTALDLTPAITAGTTNALSLTGNTLTSNVNGITSSSDAVSGVSNASSVNTSTVTVNGIISSGAPIINANETSLSGASLTTTVNGVASTALDLTPAITAGTTNALSLSGNTLTSNVNGITSSSDAVSGVSNASSVNTSTVTVNGITSSGAPIINTNETSLSGTNLTTTVNGVASAALDLTPAIAAGTTVSNTSSVNSLSTTVNGVTGTAVNIVNSNTLTATNGSLVSTVNGVASTPSVPVLVSANNGLTALNGNVQLGGTLTTPTSLATNATNTLAISGLQPSVSGTDNLIVADGTGILKTLPSTVLNNWHTTGNSGTTATTLGGGNYIGTIDHVGLNFRVGNDHAGWIGYQTAGIGTSSVYFGVNSGFAGAALSNAAYGNIGIGDNALAANTTNGNTAVGTFALQRTVSGFNNVALGYLTLQNNLAGQSNTALGTGALQNTTGSFNVGVGSSAGVSNSIGTNNSFIGTLADLTGSGLNVTNATAIGYNAKVGASNSMVLGGTGSDAVKVGIGNTIPSNTLHITSTADPIRAEGLQAGNSATDSFVVATATGILRTVTASNANFWRMTGNGGTDSTVNFLGTTDGQSLIFKINNVKSGILSQSGVTAFGHKALSNSVGTNNTAFGHATLMSTSSGTGNVAVGYRALEANTGNYNNAVGVGALLVNNSGNQNVGMGNSALGTFASGTGNTALGYQAGANIASGSQNIIIGNTVDLFPLAPTTGGSNRLNIGNAIYGTGVNNLSTLAKAAKIGINIDTPQNTLHVSPQAVGIDDPVRIDGLLASVATTDNVVVVDATGVLKTRSSAPLNTNNWNILGNAGTTPGTNFVGTTDSNQLNFKVNNVPAGKIGITGGDPYFPNTYLGYNAGAADAGTTLPSASTAFSNTAFGGNALTAITTGWYNTALGANALPVNTTGFGNTAIGPNTLTKNTIGFNNIAIGNGALLNTNATDGNNGNNNVAIGGSTLRSNTTGFKNIAIGAGNLYGNTTGSYNVCIGGTGSTDGNTTNNYGTFLGYAAAAGLAGTTDAIGIGHSAVTNANYGVAIGSNSHVLTGAVNSVVIGRNANTSASNAIILGAEVGNLSLIPAPFVGIGTTAPLNSLHVKPTTNADPVRFEGLMNGLGTDNVVVADASGVLRIISSSLIALEPWQTQSSTVKATSNTDAIYQMGKVGIGTANLLGTIDPSVWLAVNGSIQTATTTYPDYVFENYFNKTGSSNEKYSFKSLKEIEKFVNENKHLPGVTGITELSKNEKGDYIFNVTKLSVQVLEKVEELYLHVIEQQKELEAKDKEIQNLKQKSAEMDLRLERLEKLLEQTSSNK
ncbi:beta strand repeat-containing protein [Flavobacterium sp. FlaQc-28]|uniref:beta strand repeat-containing protein n=1 Tax=Flavobacterium sp. FlaQc-28 TaxID=3374178 RepID=UPI0037572146